MSPITSKCSFIVGQIIMCLQIKSHIDSTGKFTRSIKGTLNTNNQSKFIKKVKHNL